MTDDTSFERTIVGWTQRTKSGTEAVFRGATADLVEELRRPVTEGGNMPVDTGYLRESLDASYTTPPRASDAHSGGTPMVGLSLKVAALIKNLKLGQKLHLGFLAGYAARQNYGFTGQDRLGRSFNMAGHHFLELAIQRWPELVKQRARRHLTGGESADD